MKKRAFLTLEKKKERKEGKEKARGEEKRQKIINKRV